MTNDLKSSIFMDKKDNMTILNVDTAPINHYLLREHRLKTQIIDPSESTLNEKKVATENDYIEDDGDHLNKNAINISNSKEHWIEISTNTNDKILKNQKIPTDNLIGAQIQKYFPLFGWYTGKVKFSWFSKGFGEFFRIEYSDGDEEDFTYNQLIESMDLYSQSVVLNNSKNYFLKKTSLNDSTIQNDNQLKLDGKRLISLSNDPLKSIAEYIDNTQEEKVEDIKKNDVSKAYICPKHLRKLADYGDKNAIFNYRLDICLRAIWTQPKSENFRIIDIPLHGSMPNFITMDLDNVRKKCTANFYNNIDEFIKDIHLIPATTSFFYGKESTTAHVSYQLIEILENIVKEEIVYSIDTTNCLSSDNTHDDSVNKDIDRRTDGEHEKRKKKKEQITDNKSRNIYYNIDTNVTIDSVCLGEKQDDMKINNVSSKEDMKYFSNDSLKITDNFENPCFSKDLEINRQSSQYTRKSITTDNCKNNVIDNISKNFNESKSDSNPKEVTYDLNGNDLYVIKNMPLPTTELVLSLNGVTTHLNSKTKGNKFSFPTKSTMQPNFITNNSSFAKRKMNNKDHLTNGYNITQVIEDKNENSNKIGIYSPISRQKRLEKFREKRKRRKFIRNVVYKVRKTLAIARPRFKGRFAKVSDTRSIINNDKENDNNVLSDYINKINTTPFFKDSNKNNKNNNNLDHEFSACALEEKMDHKDKKSDKITLISDKSNTLHNMDGLTDGIAPIDKK